MAGLSKEKISVHRKSGEESSGKHRRHVSITRRWIVNTICVEAGVLLIVGVIFAMLMSNYYNNTAQQAVMSRANTMSTLILRNSEDSTANFNREFRSLIEDFTEKDRMAVYAISHDGRVVLSSTGFEIEGKPQMPDFEEAVLSSNGIGRYIGIAESGEKILAISVLVPYLNSEYCAVRYVVSMEQLDTAWMMFIGIYIIGALAVMLLVTVSGLYFVRSIVIPVHEVGAAARKFASGDLSIRLKKKNDDELGELCDLFNDMADELLATENMKNEFISSVSHELRTPLTAIRGWTETLNDLPYDKETMQKGMHVILNETDRLSGMVEELLDFSRIQSGRFTLIREKIDIVAELSDAVLIFTERARKENKKLIYEEPMEIAVITGDRNRLRQVFINIIDNALKYSDEGDAVTVDAGLEGDLFLLRIADTGCGISKQDLPHVKEKFFKANNTRRGSGIGLAVANEIVSMHGGYMDIESELDVGTIVTIRIPLDQVDLPEEVDRAVTDSKFEDIPHS